MPSAPKVDEEIPDLVNTAGLAAAAGLTRSEVSILYSMGHVPGRQVGPKSVVFRKDATVELLKENPNPSLAVHDDKIPDLVNSEVAAALREITRQRLDKLRQDGRIEARVVSPRLVLFRREVATRAELYVAQAKPRVDRTVPDLVDRNTAAEMLGIDVGTLIDYYRGGLIPGAKYDSGAESKKGEGVVFRRAVIDRLAKKLAELDGDDASPLARKPADDPEIPDLMTSGQAGELLGGTRETARNRYLHGHLPGREIEGAPGEKPRLVFRKKAVVEHKRRWDSR